MKHKTLDRDASEKYLQEEQSKLSENGIKLIMGFGKNGDGKFFEPNPIFLTKHSCFSLEYPEFCNFLKDCICFYQAVKETGGNIDKLMALEGGEGIVDVSGEDVVTDADGFVKVDLES